MPVLPAVRTSFRPLVLLLSILAPVGLASAQSPDANSRPVGTRVRVSTAKADDITQTRRATGVLDALTRDSVTVSWDKGGRSTLSHAEISRLDMSLGPRTYVLRGMGMGFLGGVLAGAVVGAITYEEEDTSSISAWAWRWQAMVSCSAPAAPCLEASWGPLGARDGRASSRRV